MAYRNWLQRKPDETMAKIGLAQCELMLRVSGVDFEEALAQSEKNPNSVSAQKLAADIEIAQGQVKSAFDRLINVVKTSTGDEKKEAKEHLLLLFQLVDPSDPDLIRARTQLASALF